jgi:hypothetical protein
MQRAKGAVESALPNNQRAAPIRAIKMNVAPQRLLVDFLFVDNSGQSDSIYMIAVITNDPYPGRGAARS